MAVFLKKYFINFLFLFLAFALFQKVIWVKDFFGDRTNYIEILYNITVKYDGVKNVPSSFKYFFIKEVIIYPFIMAITWLFLLEKSKSNSILKNLLQNHRFNLLKFILSKFYKFLLNYKFYLIIGLCFYLYKLDFLDFFIVNKNLKEHKKLYQNPHKIKFIEPKNKKNLILFYTESLEYQIRSFDIQNPIQKIDDIKGNYIDDFKHAPATAFSIGGVVSSQCSLPFYPALSMNLTLLKQNELLCLSDVLNKYNYKQVFYITVPGDFHGFSTFKKKHFYEVYDRDKILDEGLPKERLTGWAEGVQDDDLLNHALQKIKELHKSKKPFNVTIITTDTHFPYTVSPRCNDRLKENLTTNKYYDVSQSEYYKKLLEKGSYFKKLLKAYRCSSQFIYDFFNDLEQSGVLEDTTVVIMGDHIMSDRNDFTVSKHLDRNVYFKMNNKNKFYRNKINHFDVAPTILDDMGFLPSNTSNFGFGVSALRDYPNYNEHYTKVMNKRIVSDFLIHKLLNTSKKGYEN
ncbi:MAG: sulfatase-like hydrolase/transferase [Pelagibacteraceae bacterium]|nr:sulfatase-like hydrolase/transferase [Pelagibacteraceae bacterium]MCI5079105.1 sulfatase-like hydrolase/transferase [Pelagibacteraceae bacterium]